MISIPGYNISQIIVREGDYAYYRGIRIDKGLEVIIKTHVDHSPANSVIRALERELNLLKTHSLSFSLNPISIVKFPGRLALTFENWESPTLGEIMEKGQLDLLPKLKIAGAIAEALQDVHERGLAHLRICPHNILSDPDNYCVRILGFESALDMGATSFNDPLRVFRGESARYAAPEQSGRMNISPDHRSDLYALGICLFEMISGRTPFQSMDPLELTHFHMAETPETLESLIPDIPRPVSKLVARLLSKNPRDRYQNALGVQEDLQNIASRIENSQDIYHIDLGVTDSLRNFRIPDGFYGREDLMESLTSQFDLCEREQRSICLLSGEAGVGKTTLALRLAKYTQSRNGRFIQSKFRQFDRNVPYSALIDAFGQAGGHMLSLSDSELAVKRETLRSALGDNAGVITMALPELELIIGPQPPPQEIGPEEAHNRFLHVVRSFVRALTSMERPLVIFIDDLHWADAGSLKLIETLAKDGELGSFMFIAAYRDGALTEDPALAAAIERIRTAGENVHEYHLEPLAFEDILELISGVFVSDRDSLKQLAELIHGRSSGNPFFAKELLAMIHKYELAGFNKDEKTWKWDINAIKAQAFSEDILELIVNKIKTMPDDIQNLLKVASCAGGAFDTRLISDVMDLDLAGAENLIEKAMNQDFVVMATPAPQPEDGSPKDPHTCEAPGNRYHLVHDRVQQAAYLLLDHGERKSIHRAIGELLLLRMNGGAYSRSIFEVVSQLNLGANGDAQEAADYRLAELNLRAGRQAHNSAAYEAGFVFLISGVNMLDNRAWDTHYQLALDLCLQAAEEAYLCADFQVMDALLSTIRERAKNQLERIRAIEIEIQALVAQGKNTRAVEVALPPLAQLGVKLPPEPSRAQVLASFIKTRIALIGVRIDRMIDLPEMSDPELIAAMRILARLASAVYVSQPELVPVIAFRMVRLSLKHGNTPATAYAYTGCGLIFCQVFGNIQAGYEFGELALKLVDKFDAKELKARTTFSVNCFITHWKRPLLETLEPLKNAFHAGIETGDLEAATAAAFIHSRYSFFAGRNLNELDDQMGRFDKVIDQAGQVSFLNAHRSTRQTVRNLIDCQGDPWILSGDIYDEFRMVNNHHRDEDARALLLYHFNKLYLNCLFNRYDEAQRHGQEGEAYLDRGRATHTIPLFHFYYALSILRNPFKKEAGLDVRKSRPIRSAIKKFRLWTAHSLENHQRRKLILEAELARASGRAAQAESLYNRAVSSSHAMGMINESALAHELAGEFYLEKGSELIARSFLEEAVNLYRQWGAGTKADQLEARHRGIVRRLYPGEAQVRTQGPSVTEESLDFAAAVEASQAISGEIHIEKLMKTLMRLVLAVGGAEKAFLITNTEDGLRVEARAQLGEGRIEVLESMELEEGLDLPLSIVNYVARTREKIVLANASEEGIFINDPYIRKSRAQSIVCAPIIRQTRLSAILCLENSLTDNAFTPARIEVLRLICSQAAISLENAKLYRKVQDYSRTLEKRVVDRTKELKEINVKLIDEIRVRQETEKALKDSEKRFRDMAELLPQYVFEIDLEGNFLFLNRYGLDQIGHTEEDLDRGLNSLELFAPEDRERALENIGKVIQGQSLEGNEYRFITKNNRSFPAIIFSAPIHRGDKIVGVRGVAVDISDAKKAEEKIRLALEEKEALLREIHHRVKNNLQIMTSLLSLQCRHADNHAVKTMLMDARNRVTSMSLIHELLYESEGLAAINLQKFINRLTNQMAEAYGALAKGVKIQKDVDDISFGVDIALPIGFLVTELISNAFKHAFPAGSPGTVHIGLKASENGAYTLLVKDDGIGLPDNKQFKESGALGFRLLQIFTGQLDAKMEINSHDGLECLIKFNVGNERSGRREEEKTEE